MQFNPKAPNATKGVSSIFLIDKLTCDVRSTALQWLTMLLLLECLMKSVTSRKDFANHYCRKLFSDNIYYQWCSYSRAFGWDVTLKFLFNLNFNFNFSRGYVYKNLSRGYVGKTAAFAAEGHRFESSV